MFLQFLFDLHNSLVRQKEKREGLFSFYLLEKGDSWKLIYYTELHVKKVTKPEFQSRPPDFAL